MGRGQGAAKHPIGHRAAPNANSPEVENSYVKALS